MFDERSAEAVTIDVRQNEVIVVPPKMMRDVQYMYTGGLSPCVGLVLWCSEMCAVGHFHTWETIGQCEPLVVKFAELSKDQPRKAVIVRAIGNTAKGGAWHSEHMVSDLQALLSAQGLRGEEVRPAALGESAKVCVCLDGGEIEYAFTYARDSKLKRVAPSGYDDENGTDWIARPISASYVVIGVCEREVGICYERGYSTQLVRNLLKD
jgi:hypothetical protein